MWQRHFSALLLLSMVLVGIQSPGLVHENPSADDDKLTDSNRPISHQDTASSAYGGNSEPDEITSFVRKTDVNDNFHKIDNSGSLSGVGTDEPIKEENQKEAASTTEPLILGMSPATKYLGTSSFLFSNLVAIASSTNENALSPSSYNPLFMYLKDQKRTEELEVLMIYMKTYEKDIVNKCSMAMRMRKHEAKIDTESMDYLLVRCAYWGRTVFNYLHMNFLFYDLDFAFETFYKLINNGGVNMDLGEAEDQFKARNELFFQILGKEIVEAMIINIGAQAGILPKTHRRHKTIAGKFSAIQSHYGPSFLKIFESVLDSDVALRRRKVVLGDYKQLLLDRTLGISQLASAAERRRVEQGTLFDDNKHSIKGRSADSLYRYYGKDWDVPFFDAANIYAFKPRAENQQI